MSNDDYTLLSEEGADCIKRSFISENDKLMSKVLELKNSQKFCDILISKDDTIVHAHSCILAASSPFLLDLFMNLPNDWSFKRPLKLSLSCLMNGNENSDMNCLLCFSTVIDFIYSRKIYLESTHIDHLLSISCQLEMQELIVLCQKFINSRMNETESVNNFNMPDETVKETTSTICPISENDVKYENAVEMYEVLERVDTNSSPKSMEEFSTNNYITSTYDMQNDKEDSVDTRIENNIEQTGEYNCVKCKLKFCDLQIFELHKKVFHKKQFICLSCDFTSLKLSFMVSHLLSSNHKETCCSVCLYRAADVAGLKEHLKGHTNHHPFKCDNCGRLLKTRTEWLRHTLTHNPYESFTCKQCGSTFNSKLSLQTHMLSHKDPTVLTCDVCGFIAPFKSILERHHLKHKEKISKIFTCPIPSCSFTSNYKYNLKEHLSSHEATKSFSCETCLLKFTQEKNLRRHILTVHSEQDEFYECCRCSYKNARLDKAKIHCETLHANDHEALTYLMKQRFKKKGIQDSTKKKSQEAKIVDSICDTEDNDALSKDPDSGIHEKGSFSNDYELITPSEGKKTFILSETTGEFHIISETKGEHLPVASVTSTNVLTIGNFREGTGSVTLNETTGIMTFNNINSESTGAVFLNESTGELSYINLGKESLKVEVNNATRKNILEEQTQLNEVTGEIFTVGNVKSVPDLNDDDIPFDSFDMDIGNEDSYDGFDDLDGLLFDPIDVESGDPLDLFISKSKDDSFKGIPHLNEATGELSFDPIESQKNTEEWSHNCSFEPVDIEKDREDSYRVLLNEFTGEFT